MSAGATSSTAAGARTSVPAAPAPEFEVLEVASVPFTASPTLRFGVRARDTSGADIFTIALGAQVQVEPALRTHDQETRQRLQDLFGSPERWATTTKSLVWTRLTALVPSFRGETVFDLTAPLSYDLDLGLARYLHALEPSDVPLSFHFSGSVVYRDDTGRVQIVQVPWSEVPFTMPIAAWRAAMDEHYPDRGWVGVRQETLERLLRFKADAHHLTLDQAVGALLELPELER